VQQSKNTRSPSISGTRNDKAPAASTSATTGTNANTNVSTNIVQKIEPSILPFKEKTKLWK